jgi:F420-non-reducing hydrogenase iron-sulfur subunit
MAEPFVPDVVVDICHNCIPQAGQLPRRWKQGQSVVSVREVPCSGKVDIQYLLHALEDVRGGVCVVACPPGRCRLTQGNHRAEVRIGTVRRLLSEIGIEPERAQLLHCSAEDPITRLEQLIRGAVDRVSTLGPNPLLNPAPREQPPVNQNPEQRLGPARRTSPLIT